MDNKDLLARTEAALAKFVLNPNDSKSVIRWEKLSRLRLAIARQVAKDEAAKAKEEVSKELSLEDLL